MPSAVATSDCRLARRSAIMVARVSTALQVPSASRASHIATSAAQSLAFNEIRFMIMLTGNGQPFAPAARHRPDLGVDRQAQARRFRSLRIAWPQPVNDPPPLGLE
ncbi:hypothetical protein CS8_019140 [Cupriavidus sp. 8B]